MNHKPIIILPTYVGKEIVKQDEIIYINSNNKTANVKLENNTCFDVRLGIGELYKMLDKDHFIRSHRTCILNISKIRKILGNYNSVELMDGTQKPIARANKTMFKEKFDKYFRVCNKID